MAKLLKLRRGTTSQHSSFTGAEGEVTVDTDKESLVVHNGSTAGGFALARADSPDSQKTRWGDGPDLEIYHDPTHGHSFIKESGSGGLIIGASVFEVYDAAISDKLLSATADGNVELYYDNSKKFETHSAGCKVSAGNLYLDRDDAKVVLGAGDDLQIYHSSSNNHSYIIESGSGSLVVLADDFYVQNNATETMIKAASNGAVELYEDNVLKLRTGTDGERGSVEAKAGKGSDWDGYSIGGYYAFLANNRGNADTVLIYNDLDNETMFLGTRGGSTKLYYDGTAKLDTLAAGAQVHGNLYQHDGDKAVYGTGDDLQIHHSSNQSTIYNSHANGLAVRSDVILLQNDAGDHDYLTTANETGVSLYYDNNKKFETTSDGSTVTGRLIAEGASIGTSNTNSFLTLNSGGSNNAVSIRNTTGGNGHVGILFSTQDHSGGREKAAIFHQETHGQAHYGGDIAFCLNTATGGAAQVSISDRKATITRHGGICFNADTADANCLDDYEEGNLSWQLRKSGSTSTGTDNGSNVKYTKVGRMVHITGRIRTDSTPGDGNEFFYLSGTLPFTPSTSGTAVIGHLRSQDQEDSSLTASLSWVGSSTTVYLYCLDQDGDYAADENNIPANTQTNLVITFNLTYQA